ncbi:hypothetical protein LCGC14_2986710 [marine sediment metagenome]|uniref:DUF5681 domain-containing protein n=1 Tax=marine sediment metagenome TaxID=412755 RepID=A0A0F8X5X5_9ZZZZ
MTDELNPVKHEKSRGFLEQQYKPGQSGNPAGRPPGIRYLSELARDILKQSRRGDTDGKTTDELVVLALVKEALKGNTKAIEMLHDWTEGKVLDTHRIEGDGIVSILYKQVKRDEDAKGTSKD